MSKRRARRRSRIAKARRKTAHDAVVRALERGVESRRAPIYPLKINTIRDVQAFGIWAVENDLTIYAVQMVFAEQGPAGIPGLRDFLTILHAQGIRFTDEGDIYTTLQRMTP